MNGQRHRGATVRRGRVWRSASLSAVTVAVTVSVGAAGVRADEPIGVEGATVEVGLPPVPPTSVVMVEVGLPPVPPTSVVMVEVGLPPVPPVPDTGDDGRGDDGGGPVVDVTSSIAGAVAATAVAAWRSA